MNLGVIPARLNSKRFPKKVLAKINDKPMVIHTAEQVVKSKLLDRVIIAIDSDETYNAIKDFGFEIMMTSKNHKSGTDRVAEIVEQIDDVDIIINIQADEPFIDPSLIDDLIKSFEDADVKMSTLISTAMSEEDLEDKNIVKASLDNSKYATDFSRDYGEYKHLGIYAFTRQTLLQFVSYSQTENEKNRKLEQMRALDNGIKIKSVITDKDSLSINVKGDMDSVQA
tara:strand:+ start:6206 stop:6883 length:678 start_codon:yes stop_codon:yes gene_type:complete